LNFDGTIRRIAEDRPIDALLAAYAARTLGAPMAALVAAHLELKPDNRAYVAALEAAHGVFLEELRPVPLAGRDRRLVNIFASPDLDPGPAAPTRPANDAAAVLPRALRRLTGCDYADLSWRGRAPGVRDAMLPRDSSRQDSPGAAGFVSARPGRQLPMPCEDGLAVGLMLVGSASDRSGYHERGDIVFAGPDVADGPTAEGDDDCVCFIVTEGPAKPAGPLSRMLQRVIGG
jgi:putative transcriptional regulator